MDLFHINTNEMSRWFWFCTSDAGLYTFAITIIIIITITIGPYLTPVKSTFRSSLLVSSNAKILESDEPVGLTTMVIKHCESTPDSVTSADGMHS